MSRTVKQVLLDWFVCRPFGHKIDWAFRSDSRRILPNGHAGGIGHVDWFCARCGVQDPL